jgi:hypothetical protein
MELLLGFAIILVVLVIVFASRNQAPPANLTDAGLVAQIEAVLRWIERFDAIGQPNHKIRQQHQRQQSYLADLRQESDKRKTSKTTAVQKAD